MDAQLLRGSFFLLVLWHRELWASARMYIRLALFRVEEQKPGADADDTARSGEGKIPPSTPNMEDAELLRNKQEATAIQKPINPPWVTQPSVSDTVAPYQKPNWPAYIKAYLKELLNWDRLVSEDHWPPWVDYVYKEYDPNRWEALEL